MNKQQLLIKTHQIVHSDMDQKNIIEILQNLIDNEVREEAEKGNLNIKTYLDGSICDVHLPRFRCRLKEKKK